VQNGIKVLHLQGAEFGLVSLQRSDISVDLAPCGFFFFFYLSGSALVAVAVAVDMVADGVFAGRESAAGCRYHTIWH
jgi:hypothetical protein